MAAARRLVEKTPERRRHRYEVYLAVVGLELARRRGDIDKAEEQMRAAVLDEPGPAALIAAFPDATLDQIDRKEA